MSPKRKSIKEMTATEGSAPDPTLPGTPLWKYVWDHYRSFPWVVPLDQWLVRWTGRSVIIWLWTKLSGADPLPGLVLETIGRRSGQLRVSVLPYFEAGGDLIVLGTLGGGPKDPMWVHNLRNSSYCWRQVRRQRIAMTGRIAGPDERERWKSAIPDYWKRTLPRYETRASGFGREIPFVILSPHRPPPNDNAISAKPLEG
jgi:F420H(2)-dependent quinone reductase